MPTPKKNGRYPSKPTRRNSELTRAKRILRANLERGCADMTTSAARGHLEYLRAAMLLQKGSQITALRALLQSESERGSDFRRLANELSALYPRESAEKGLLDALLVNVKR